MGNDRIPSEATPLARIFGHESEYWTTVSAVEQRAGFKCFHNPAYPTRFDPNHAGDFCGDEGDGLRIVAEVIDFYRIGGDWDYLIKVVTRGMSGYDAFYQKLITNFDLATVKRSCVHFVTGDGQIIPFDTYNTFYREGAEGAAVLARHRALLGDKA